MNEMIKVNGDNLVISSSREEALGREVSVIEKQAGAVNVTSDVEYQVAGTMVKEVKRMQKSVKDYWEPLRVSAKESYDLILNRKKAMMSPLEAAEKIIKGKMADYTMTAKAQAEAKEEAMRKMAALEVDRKLAEAAAAEAAGDFARAEYAMAEAEVMENVSIAGGVIHKPVKADGVSQSKSWRITNIDPAKVPINFSGVEIRPVDEKAVLRLIKESKGTINIPGITFEETVSISVRS